MLPYSSLAVLISFTDGYYDKLKKNQLQATPFVVTFDNGTAKCQSFMYITYIGMYNAPPPTPPATAKLQIKNAGTTQYM